MEESRHFAGIKTSRVEVHPHCPLGIFKKCSACGQMKLVRYFSSDKGKKDGLCTSCKDCKHRADKEYRETPRGKYRSYRIDAKKRGIPFPLAFSEFENYWQKPCFYCGYKIRTIGLDRIDNSKPYEAGNVVECCSWCNRAKGTMSQSQFLTLCDSVAKRHPNKSNSQDTDHSIRHDLSQNTYRATGGSVPPNGASSDSTHTSGPIS